MDAGCCSGKAASLDRCQEGGNSIQAVFKHGSSATKAYVGSGLSLSGAVQIAPESCRATTAILHSISQLAQFIHQFGSKFSPLEKIYLYRLLPKISVTTVSVIQTLERLVETPLTHEIQMNLTTKIALRGASLIATALLAGASWAAAPQQKFQAPGFYRMMLGQFEVTALHDGTIDLEPGKLLTNTTPKKVETALDASFQGSVIPASVNAFLINTGEKLVLIDSGTGPSGIFGPSLGQLLKNLTASGYSPEQVDEVYFTHIHPDHVGGLITPAGEVFPNAVIRLDQRELAYWTDSEQAKKAPEGHRPFFAFAESALKPYKAAGRLKPFDGNAELTPGIKAISAVGHTLGHTVYKVESQGQRMLVWGDVMHVGAIQFAQPQVTIVFDSDSPTAAKARAKVFAEAAADRAIVAAAHQPFPGLGHLLRTRTGYQFVPYPFGGVK